MSGGGHSWSPSPWEHVETGVENKEGGEGDRLRWVPDNASTSLSIEFAQKPLEPLDGLLAVRNRVAPHSVIRHQWLCGAIRRHFFSGGATHLRTAKRPSNGSSGSCANSLFTIYDFFGDPAQIKSNQSHSRLRVRVAVSNFHNARPESAPQSRQKKPPRKPRKPKLPADPRHAGSVLAGAKDPQNKYINRNHSEPEEEEEEEAPTPPPSRCIHINSRV
ncbi:hypothetical protein DFH09DRAFT_1079847 [Mycena vulgaris]|nr:hypothetical protein DFH09DRAFT_1079847 [Mycena vulgaris]